MRLLGVLGGMSWTSTESYYRLLNTGVAERLGGLHSARLLLHSVDFDEIATRQHDGDWDGTAAILAEAARGLGAAGADGLLATGFTMEDAFYVDRLATHRVEAIVPDAPTRAEVHRIIYDELVRDVVGSRSREVFRQAMAALVADGADGMIFGCTEIGLLVGPEDTAVPTFDTTQIHVAAAVDWMLA